MYVVNLLYISITVYNLTGDKLHSQVCYSNNLKKQVKPNDKTFECDVCLKVFSCKSELTTHYRTHTREKPFACQICDKKFSVKCNLVRHQATHSDVKSFKCSICHEGRFFKIKSHLSNHMFYHYEPKFSCSRCDHKSYTKTNLRVYENTHVNL